MSDLGPRQYRNRLNQLFPRNDNDDLEAINAPNEGLPEPSSDTLTNNEDQNRHFNMVFSSDPAPELEAENIMEMLLNDHNVNDHVLVGELLDIHGDELINEDVEEGGILFEVPLKSNNESSDEDGIKEEQARRNFNLNENMPLYLGADITVKEMASLFFSVRLTKAKIPRWVDWILIAYVILYAINHILLSIAGLVVAKKKVESINTFPMKDLRMRSVIASSIKKDAPLAGFRKIILSIYVFGIALFVIILLVITVLAPIEDSWNEFIATISKY